MKQASLPAGARIAGLVGRELALGPVFDAIPTGLAVLDADLRICLMNRALETMTGFTTAEVAGIPCRHVLRASVCLHRCPTRTAVCDATGGNAPCHAQEGDLLNRHRRRIPVRLTLAPLHDAQGQLCGWLHTAEDLSLVRELEERCSKGQASGPLVGRSVVMEELFRTVQALAQTETPVLITGETGTGKDAVAETIHKASPRGREPFVKASLSSLPDFLVESELFGHRKGAFPGAEEDKPGRFRMAQGGTLCLSELGDLPPAMQGRLVTFLDEGLVWPVGATDSVRCDVRLLVASNLDLEAMVASGRLREDLYSRLAAVRIHLPPLRERGEDLEFLLSHYLAHFAARLRKTIHGFSGKSLRVLLAYGFPGNVRELKNIVEYAATLCTGEVVMPSHLPAYLFHTRPAAAPPRAIERDTPKGAAEDEASARSSVVDLERRLIVDALARAGNRKGEAARILGWGRSTLWRKMKQFGLE